MTGVSFRVLALTAASLLLACEAQALSFDERWKSMYADSDVTGEQVSAKAEMLPRAERSQRVQRLRLQRPRADRHRVSSRRGERRREWSRGGKKWHYVTSRKRGRG